MLSETLYSHLENEIHGQLALFHLKKIIKYSTRNNSQGEIIYNQQL